MAQSINSIDKEFKLYKDISAIQEHHEKEMDRYQANWTVNFPEPVEIYAVTGNTDSSHMECSLVITNIAKGKKFNNWKQVAKYLRNNQEFFRCCDEEEEDYLLSRYLNVMFEDIVNCTNLDPVMFVYANNPMIQWFKNVRGITN